MLRSAFIQPFVYAMMVGLGRYAVETGEAVTAMLAMLGRNALAFGRVATGRQNLRWNAYTRHLRETGLEALPIIAVTSFLLSIVLAYQGIQQLRIFGAEQYSINLLAISILREMAGILTAIMVAARSGSAFTSEIGVMKVREEVDALEVMGFSPLNVLTLPRILALLTMVPLLTFWSIVASAFGGAAVSFFLLHLPLTTYLDLFVGAVNFHTFFIGMVKTPVYALLIGLVGCAQGMKVSGSAESVGQRTTMAVVQSIFAVLMADALFSVFFTAMEW